MVKVFVPVVAGVLVGEICQLQIKLSFDQRCSEASCYATGFDQILGHVFVEFGMFVHFGVFGTVAPWSGSGATK